MVASIRKLADVKAHMDELKNYLKNTPAVKATVATMLDPEKTLEYVAYESKKTEVKTLSKLYARAKKRIVNLNVSLKSESFEDRTNNQIDEILDQNPDLWAYVMIDPNDNVNTDLLLDQTYKEIEEEGTEEEVMGV